MWIGLHPQWAQESWRTCHLLVACTPSPDCSKSADTRPVTMSLHRSNLLVTCSPLQELHYCAGEVSRPKRNGGSCMCCFTAGGVYLPALLIWMEAVLVQGLGGQVTNQDLVVIHCPHSRRVAKEVIKPARYMALSWLLCKGTSIDRQVIGCKSQVKLC